MTGRNIRCAFFLRSGFLAALLVTAALPLSVKKAGSNWELEIKGGDEPNRATVLLDSEFKIVKVTKIR
jgi:hypothetical protein